MDRREEIVGEIDRLVDEYLRLAEGGNLDQNDNRLQPSAWVILIEQRSADSADLYSGMARIYSSEGLSWPHALGIVRAGALRLEDEWVNPDDY